jgi:hypothetical protein
MKTNFKFLQCLMMFILLVSATGALALNQDPTQTICIGTQPYSVDISLISGATYQWSVSGGGTITSGNGTPNITINWTIAGGPYTVSVYTSANGCNGPQQSISVTVTTNPSATVTYIGNPFCTTSGIVPAILVGSTGGTFSAPTGLTIDPATGTITPSSSTPGTYIVTYFITGTIYCSSFTTTTTVTITDAPTATISYAGSPFCTSIATPQAVTLIGTTGGAFSALPAGLTIDITTGAVTPSTSSLGTFSVTYTIAASGGCALKTATTSVTITTAPTATIYYAGSPFCNSITTPQTVTLTGTTGGAFSALPAGLTIDASTGAIIPNTSSSGVYTVTYTIAATGGCAMYMATTTVTITTAPTATISYAGSPFCNSIIIPQAVTLAGTTGGAFNASPGGLTIDPVTGAVLPSTSSAGVYTVTYTIAASYGCLVVTTTTPVTIYLTPSTSPIWHN